MTATEIDLREPAATAASVRAAGSGRSVGWWGVVCLIATEGMLFALLLFTNFYLRSKSASWPQGGIEDPELVKSGIRTAILLGSTIPAVVAERAAKRGDRTWTMIGLAGTILMGAVFLAGHVEEYLTLWDTFQPSTNAYGSVFYTITSLHALHVLIGIVVLGFLLWRCFTGHLDRDSSDPVGNGVLYWHFVDVVWVFVFSSLYLSVSLW